MHRPPFLTFFLSERSIGKGYHLDFKVGKNREQTFKIEDYC